MELKNKLTDCVKNITYDFVIKTLKDYYADIYYDDAEGIFDMQNVDDFKRIIDIYSLECAVDFYNKYKIGHIIAGINIEYDKVIHIGAGTYKQVFDKFTDIIEDRIVDLYEHGFHLTEIKRKYKTIDIRKMIFGDSFEVIRMEYKDGNKVSEGNLGAFYETEDDCNKRILADIETLIDSFFDFSEDFNYQIKRTSRAISFTNHTDNVSVIYHIKEIDEEVKSA